MSAAAQRLPGPLFSIGAVLLGVAVGSGLRPFLCSQVAGCLWLLGVGSLLAACVAPSIPRATAWVAPALAGYALLLVFVQPSLRVDGDAVVGVRKTAAWLVPAVAGGVTLPCRDRWLAAAGCWCVVLALSAAAAALVWHPSASVGLFAVVWD